MHRILLAAATLALAACSPQDQPLMSWADLTAQALPEPSGTLRYGDHDAAIVDLWLPEGEGPHPVVVMIHGGCWQKAIADRTLMNYAAEELRQRGLAVWNIEYRGVDEEGGGYPGTFLDVGDALDLLTREAERFDLRTDRIAVFGHSAGGHLAVWAASRENLPRTSRLSKARPLDVDLVVNSGGLADLKASEPITLTSCLADIRTKLIGDRPDAYADTSPAELLPPYADIVSVNGELDRIAPPALGVDFTRMIQENGGTASFVEIEGAGHVELIAPGTEAFDRQADILKSAF